MICNADAMRMNTNYCFVTVYALLMLPVDNITSSSSVQYFCNARHLIIMSFIMPDELHH